MVIVKCSKSFDTQARTLPIKVIGENDSGWKVEGTYNEDHYEWISDFKAIHKVYGKVEGDFEEEVRADSLKGLKDFLKNHPYDEWDYHDI